MHLAFLGFGQIGGSVARAAASSGYATRISAWTPTGHGPRAAASHGIEASTTAAAAIRGADLIVLAAPPLDCLTLLDELAEMHRRDPAPERLITDVASTKAAIVVRARSLGLRFVGGHPLAGREAAGFAASDPGLFRGRPWAVIPAEPSDPAADEVVAALARACGARPIQMSAADHDAAVAAISHLPLLLSVALVEAVSGATDWPLARDLAGGGWASMTRLARGDVAMGTGILATNASAVADRVRALQAVLDRWLTDLDESTSHSGSSATFQARLAAARRQVQADDGAAADQSPAPESARPGW